MSDTVVADSKAGPATSEKLVSKTGFQKQSNAKLVETAINSRVDYDPVNEGMPLLDLGKKPVSKFEFWPAWVFYIPVTIYWLWLSLKYRNPSLPMVVNPNIPLGGMVGESKIDILDSAGGYAKKYILPYVTAEKNADLNELRLASLLKEAELEGIQFPMIVKPDLGCRGHGVSLVSSKAALIKYLEAFPDGRKFMLQKLSPYAAEAGVFYEREPNSAYGKVTSITLKYRPYVIGDGQSSLKSLIEHDSRARFLKKLYFEKNEKQLDTILKEGEYKPLAFAGSHCKGSIFRNGNAFITPELTRAIDKILLDFPEFHYGRLDIKFDNIESFIKGEDFFIIELNGASSEKTHIWDSRESLVNAFKTLFLQYRSLFERGHQMTKRGFKTPSSFTLIKTWLYELVQNGKYPKATESDNSVI